MVHSRFLWIVCGICLFALGTTPLFAQATFSVAVSSATGADIGVTEMTGQITLTVISGTTVSAPLRIQYSAPITTNYQVEIRVRGTGGLAGVAPFPLLLREDKAISIDVPAGGNVGDTITILGVRVAIAGSGITSVTATVSSPSGIGNGILAGQDTIPVITPILPPISVDLTRVPPLSFSKGTVINGSSSLIITEGYAGAFTDAVGILGQTLHTRIRLVPYPSELPSGVSVTFAANSSTDSGGVLTTISGEDETIPRDDGTYDVIYEYDSGGSVSVLPKSFTISFTLKLSGATDTGLINFQSELVPIGIAEPNADFPSRAVPRYSERLVPDASQLPGVGNLVFLNFPFRAQSDGIYTAIALTNVLPAYTNVTLTPFDSSGTQLASPKILPIPPKGQIAKLATDTNVFGPNFNVGKSGTILAEGNALFLPGFYLLGDFNGSRLDGATAEMITQRYWVWPMIFRQAPAPFTILEMFNPNNGSASVTLSLYDSSGKILKTASLSIPSSGSMAQNIQQLFPAVDFSTFSGGYIKGESDSPLVARETFGNSLDSNVLPGQVPQVFDTIYWPYFASGGGLTTELTFVNDEPTMTASLTVTALDLSGLALGQTQVNILPGAQTTTTVAQLFPNIPTFQTTVGYIRIDSIPIHIGPFAFSPAISAALRFSAANGSGSAALPFSSAKFTEFVYSHAVETVGYYTGIAILNTNAVPAAVTVEVFTNAGVSVGIASFALQPGVMIAKLLHELVPASEGQQGGYVRIKSDQSIMSLSIFGSNNGLSLSAIPPQDIGK